MKRRHFSVCLWFLFFCLNTTSQPYGGISVGFCCVECVCVCVGGDDILLITIRSITYASSSAEGHAWIAGRVKRCGWGGERRTLRWLLSRFLFLHLFHISLHHHHVIKSWTRSTTCRMMCTWEGKEGVLHQQGFGMGEYTIDCRSFLECFVPIFLLSSRSTKDKKERNQNNYCGGGGGGGIPGINGMGIPGIGGIIPGIGGIMPGIPGIAGIPGIPGIGGIIPGGPIGGIMPRAAPGGGGGGGATTGAPPKGCEREAFLGATWACPCGALNTGILGLGRGGASGVREMTLEPRKMMRPRGRFNSLSWPSFDLILRNSSQSESTIFICLSWASNVPTK